MKKTRESVARKLREQELGKTIKKSFCLKMLPVFGVGFALIIVAAALWIRSAQTQKDDLYTELTTSARLTNMYGVTLDEKYVDGHWVLGSKEEVLVWMDLPTDIDHFKGNLEATFPYEVKAGKTGTINVKLTNHENATIYMAALEFVADDDLVLEAGISHKAHGNSGDVGFWNSSSYEMNCLKDILGPGKKSYMHFSIYTSSQNDPVVFSGKHLSSVGYDVNYDIRAIGNFSERRYERVYGAIAVKEDLIGKMLPLEPSPSEVPQDSRQ